MSGPIVFISHSKVKPGKLEEYRGTVAHAVELVDAEEPRMIAFNFYASEDGTDVSTVQVHPDADSLDLHMRVFAEKLQALAADALDTSEVNVYGAPSDSTKAFLAELPSQMPDVRVRMQPVHQGGFQRPQPL